MRNLIFVLMFGSTLGSLSACHQASPCADQDCATTDVATHSVMGRVSHVGLDPKRAQPRLTPGVILRGKGIARPR